jgi:hypothetical protein
MATELSSWALPRIGRLLPLDDESLKEIIVYSGSLSKEAGAAHLQNILGDSPQALEFISSFNSRRKDVDPPSQTETERGVPRPSRSAQKKSKPPLHSTGQVRRPEGYGDVSGGYHKSTSGEDYALSSSKKGPSTTALSNALSISQQPGALQLPHTTSNAQPQQLSSLPSSRDASPRPGKLPPSAAGSLISDLPNVKTKQAKKPHGSGTSTPHYKTTTATTSSISDLTTAIAALELSTNPSLSSERRRCPCNASIHPLFTTAPNCLNCGNIICALEGLQPCSFCDSPILTRNQVSSMIRALKEERGQERMVAHNTGAGSSGKGTPVFGGTTPESGNSGDEANSAASRARAHRDKLLGFQRENAQRTRVYDEAADYDISLTPGTTQWMSPVQRAAALKKQQQYLREMEEAAKPEYEKRKTIMSMSIKNGKLVKTIQKVNATSAPTREDEEVLEEVANRQPGGDSSRTAGGGAFSHNPLLISGKLIRPIWKAPDEKGKGKEEEERSGRKSIWRRVQDDNEDNEKWILDGGSHGFGDEGQEEGD